MYYNFNYCFLFVEYSSHKMAFRAIKKLLTYSITHDLCLKILRFLRGGFTLHVLLITWLTEVFEIEESHPIIIITSNVPTRGAGTLFTGAQRPALVSICSCSPCQARRPANQCRRWWPREKPLHNGLGVTPGQYASNAEGDDDGKNHLYAENHVFR